MADVQTQHRHISVAAARSKIRSHDSTALVESKIGEQNDRRFEQQEADP